MKLIVSHFGIAGVRVGNDEVSPARGFPSKDIIDFIAKRYSFSARPPDGAETQGIQLLTFASGSFTLDQGLVGVGGISLVLNGDIAFAANTDIADAILDDLTSQLETVFGFRYSTTTKRKVYQSHITVELNVGLEEKIAGLRGFETFLNKQLPRPTPPFKIKRIGFGYGDVPNPLQMQPSLEALESADFLIERRAGAPYEANRYYSIAPMKTDEHIRLLERLEAERF
jgi:hypothetical protein